LVQQTIGFDTNPLLTTKSSLRIRRDAHTEHTPISLTAWESLSHLTRCSLSFFPHSQENQTHRLWGVISVFRGPNW
jgi:hypothetical protein